MLRISNLTRQQWLVIVTFLVVNFCNAMVVSVQAPFYPMEAEKKGCVPSEYGLVFGIFQLTVFLVSPVIGANINWLGIKATLNIGLVTVGLMSILFGLLDNVDNPKWFLGLSFTLRILQACGNSAFLTGSFSIIAREFPDSVATAFAVLETFFGMGMIVGPTVGGALYQLGGFMLPFVVLGGILVGAAFFISIVLPNSDMESVSTEKPSIFKAVKVPSIGIACYSVACAAASIGFVDATLEPHLRRFQLTPLLIGTMFVIVGATYGITGPFWGMICDRKSPKLVTTVGAISVAIGFLLMGPAPFLPLETSISLIVISLIFQGLGVSAEVVSGFADSLAYAVSSGFPDNTDTHGLISGLFTSVFALGSFIGPSAAGILFDTVGFPWGALFIVGTQAIVLVLLLGYLVKSKCRSCYPTVFADIEDDMNANLIGEENVEEQSIRSYGAI